MRYSSLRYSLLLASAAIPAVFPVVSIDGRHLMDGGVANNTPISTAVDLGATRVVVLPTGMSCGLVGPPRGAVALALHALNLLIMRQLLKDIERFAHRTELVVLPPLCPLTTNTYDFSQTHELIHRAEAIASAVSDAEQVEIVNAHPRIGANPAQISALSFKEQGYDRQSPDDNPQLQATLARLNTQYEERFGFRFVVFVNKRPKSELADVLQQRLNNADAQQELRTGLSEIFCIARDRLRGLEP